MKLKQNGVEVEEFGLSHEQEFSISEDDMGMVFELLRSKMYQNPVGSICREVASNSRDANREVGKGNVPVKISIIAPNELFNISDLSIAFEDQGPGISPARMTDVFLKYAASTKRSSNKFTGGFGLGAKTPFAYTDVFHIITVHDGIKYHYTAYIDPSQKGKVARVSATATEEPNGTKIVVPIKNGQDRINFENEVINATTFWEVRPELKNFISGRYPSYSPIFTSTKKNHVMNYAGGAGYDNSSYIACIDGIAYRLNTQILKINNLSDNKLKLVFYFPNGVLNISSNRETLQYDEETIKTLKAHIQEVSKEIGEKLNTTIAESDDVYKAIAAVNKIREHGSGILHSLYGVFSNINTSSSLNLNYKGTDLVKMSQISYNALTFNYYNVANLARANNKPQVMGWTSNPVLMNPIFMCETKLDSRRIETLKEDYSDFTIVMMPKVKFSRYDHPKTPAKLAEKEVAQKAEVTKLMSHGIVLKFEDVKRADPLPKEARAAKPDYTQIPCRAFVGANNNQVECSSWGSQTLKYDKNNDKFLFEKYPQVIYITVKALNEISNEDNKKSIVGQIASYYLNIPIVIVNERYEKNFKTQLTIEQALTKIPVNKLQETFDYALLQSKGVEGRVGQWNKLTFRKEIQDSINILKDYFKDNKYNGAYVRDAKQTLNVLTHYKITPSNTIKDALDSFESIVTIYPLLAHLSTSSFGDKGFLTATQHYLDNLK